jgi:hypothetical protein
MLRPMRGAYSYYDDFPCGLKPGRAMRRVSSNRHGISLDAAGAAGFVWAASVRTQHGRTGASGTRARHASPSSFDCRALSSDESGGKPPHSKMGQAGESGGAIFVPADDAFFRLTSYLKTLLFG